MERQRRRRWLTAIAALGPVALGACDRIPTAPPKWDTKWVIPTDSTTMTVAQLLPGQVTLSADRTAFLLALDGTTFSETLNDICSTCAALNGLVLPKPSFTSSFSDTIALPADVVSASVASGTVTATLSHTFSFDPIRPSATARGSLTVNIKSGATSLTSLLINGTDTAFPPGSPLVRTLALGGATVTGPLTVEVTLNSPAGDPVTINTNEGISVVATPTSIRIGEASVRVASRSISVEAVELDLSEVDQTVTDHLKEGTLILTLTNPFTVQGSLSLRLGNVSKTMQLASGATTQRITITGAELKSIFGRKVTLSVQGAVSAPGGTLTVRPAQVLVLRAKFELVVGPTEG